MRVLFSAGLCVSIAASSQVLAEFTRLPLPGLERSLGVHELVQLPADARHVELRGLALLPEGGRLHPQLRGGHGELLAALLALRLHPLGVAEEGLYAHGHRLPLLFRHNLGRERQRTQGACQSHHCQDACKFTL